MALLDSEIVRIKYELGYNTLTDSAAPYVGYTAIFDTVVQTWLDAGATTTSTTSVVASSAGSTTALTLDSATGFAAQARVSVDVGARQEDTFVQTVSGSTITVVLAKAHSGTYPVTVDGGESIIRECLRRIEEVKAPRGKMVSNIVDGQVAAVDEIKFFKSSNSVEQSAKELDRQLAIWRDELASALGVANMRGMRASAATSLSVY